MLSKAGLGLAPKVGRKPNNFDLLLRARRLWSNRLLAIIPERLQLLISPFLGFHLLKVRA